MPSTQEAMSAASEAEKLSQVVLGSLEDDANAGQLARRAYRSRTQFFRVFGALIEETPATMRRRLLLERAAWQLGADANRSMTDIAFDGRYGSLEAFSGRSARRSGFRRAYIGGWSHPFPAAGANAIHY